jgi:hypothetical protein
MKNPTPISATRFESNNIESHLIEKRVFNPPKAFSLKADILSFEQYQKLYRKSIAKPEEFWSQQASELLVWHKKWRNVLAWKEPFARWFAGGTLNVSEKLPRSASQRFPAKPGRPDLGRRTRR